MSITRADHPTKHLLQLKIRQTFCIFFWKANFTLLLIHNILIDTLLSDI